MEIIRDKNLSSFSINQDINNSAFISALQSFRKDYSIDENSQLSESLESIAQAIEASKII